MKPMDCPKCGNECSRDEIDVGVGVIFGPWGCDCGWSEDARYDQHQVSQPDNGNIDQWGGFTPKGKR